MLAGADDLGGWAALASDVRGAPAEAGDAKLAQGRGNENDGWQSVGALAGGIVERIKDRAPHIAPCESARAPAGEVARAGRRRNPQEVQSVTIGTTRFFATVLAGLARERPDRGEPLLGYIEAEAGYLREKMPGTADAMRDACAEARRLRGRARMAAE